VARYAVVSESTDAIEGIVVWNGQTGWTPPDGTRAVDIDDHLEYQPGGTLTEAGDYTAPEPPPEAEE